ncbi:MAG: hypothetical protein ACOWWM_20900 [Desulfobacterales bacterium]
MKNVRLKATLSDRVTVNIIELQFDEKDLNVLKLYKSNYDRLLSAKLIREGLPTFINLSWSATNGATYKFSEFSYQDVYELLHLARPLFLSREPASFDKTCAVFGKSGVNTSITNHIKYIRWLYKNGEYKSLFQVEIDDIPLFSDKTLMYWLNGVEYHQDNEKRDTYAMLENALGVETTRAIFVSQLSGRIKSVHMLAHLVNLATK